MPVIEKLVATLGITVDKTQWKAANNTLKNFAKDFFNLKLGMVAAITGFVAFENHLGKMMTHMANTSQILQIPIDKLQALQLAAKQAGVPFAALSGAIGGLQNDIVNFQSGGMAMPSSLLQGLATLARLSHSKFIDPTKYKSGLKLFSAIIPELSKIQSVAGKEGVLNQIFSNSAILPLVANGMGKINTAYAELKERGLLFTPAQMKQAQAFNSNMALVNTSLGISVDIIGQKLMPLMNEFAVAMNKLSKNKTAVNGFIELANAIGEVVKVLGELMGFVLKEINKAGDHMGDALVMTQHVFHKIIGSNEGTIQLSNSAAKRIAAMNGEGGSTSNSSSSVDNSTHNNQQSHVTTNVYTHSRASMITSHITGGVR